MYRIERRNWTEEDIGTVFTGGIFDLFDVNIKEIYRINDEEYDFICENASDDELDLIVKEPETFTDKKQIILTLNKYVCLFRQKVCN